MMVVSIARVNLSADVTGGYSFTHMEASPWHCTASMRQMAGLGTWLTEGINVAVVSFKHEAKESCWEQDYRMDQCSGGQLHAKCMMYVTDQLVPNRRGAALASRVRAVSAVWNAAAMIIMHCIFKWWGAHAYLTSYALSTNVLMLQDDELH